LLKILLEISKDSKKDLPKNQSVLLTVYKKLKQNLQMTLQILDTFHGLGGNHTSAF